MCPAQWQVRLALQDGDLAEAQTISQTKTRTYSNLGWKKYSDNKVPKEDAVFVQEF